MFDFTAIFKAITAGLNVWRQERALRNTEKMIKNAEAIQNAKLVDDLNSAAAVLKNPNSTKEQKDAAIQFIRLSHS